MSNAPETNFDLDLHFLPAWAQEPAANRFADYVGETENRDDRGRSNRPPRRGRPDRPRGAESEGRKPEGGDRRGGGGGGQRPFGRRPFGDRDRRGGDRREQNIPLPEVEVSIIPEEKGVEALSRQIKLTGRAYPLFEIGFLIVKKPERYNVKFNIIKKADGQIAQPLFLCSLDDTLWLSDQEAMDHILNRHFNMFYQTEKLPADPPKGVFTFVGQCGMSGIILGPPNYHDYQTKLRRLHTERYSYLPFEVYKSRVKIVRDEAIVKKWLEDQSFTTQYVCLNVPDTMKLGSREEVERHFRETHFNNVVQSVETFTLSGMAVRSLPCQPLAQLYRKVFEEQRRFPLKVVTTLSQMFASMGLQFFKVNKTITHVAVSRPHYLNLAVTPVTDGIKSIVEYINAHPGITRRQLVEALAPAAPTAPVIASTPSDATPQTESTQQPAAEKDQAPISPEANAIGSDLHWLIHQGHVIEFANGILEKAKMPAPKPPKQPKQQQAPAAGTEPVNTGEDTPPGQAPSLEGETVTAPQATVESEPEAQQADPGPAESPTATA